MQKIQDLQWVEVVIIPFLTVGYYVKDYKAWAHHRNSEGKPDTIRPNSGRYSLFKLKTTKYFSAK